MKGREKGMTRLEELKEERDQIVNMMCLCFDLKADVLEYYQREIDAIELFNASNPEIKEGGKS